MSCSEVAALRALELRLQAGLPSTMVLVALPESQAGNIFVGGGASSEVAAHSASAK